MTMAKRQTNKKPIAAILIILAVLAGVISAVMAGRRASEDIIEIRLFYFTGSWQSETVRLRVTDTATQSAVAERIFADIIIADTLERLMRLPEQNHAARGLTRAMDARGYIHGRTAIVHLAPEFVDLRAAERMLATAALVHTLSELHFVDYVEIHVGEDIHGPHSRANLLLDSTYLPEQGGSRIYILFFADATLAELVAVEREVALQPNLPVATLLLEELMSTVSSIEASGNVRRLIPAGVTLRGPTILESEIVYIDFSTDFLAQIDNEDHILLIVRSIINTITTNTPATQVQLLFAGDRTSITIEALDLHGPLSRTGE